MFRVVLFSDHCLFFVLFDILVKESTFSRVSNRSMIHMIPIPAVPYKKR